jgi:cell division protein FtsZ
MESKIKFNLPKEKSSIIKVIGVGGGGSNAINHMFEQGIKGVDFIVCNTDLQSLEASHISNKIQLGANLTQGLGAGANPEVGKKAAMETIEDIIDMLGVNTKMLFITAGMGGGTGTGAAPIIAKTAKEMDILTVGIVTTPFGFEGKRRKEFASEGIENLKRAVDCLLIISNDKIKDMYGNLPLREAFSHANNILTTAAKGIADIITQSGYINVDFEDVKTVMKGSGVALMGNATAEGPDRALVAVKNALASPLLNDNQILGAKNILLNISSGNSEVLMEEIGQISEYIQEESGLSAEMIFGTSFDASLGDKISVTLIATGFESKPRENKIIVGSTETGFIKQDLVKPVTPVVNQIPVTENPIHQEPVKKVLLEDIDAVKPIEENTSDIKFELRIAAEEEMNYFENNSIQEPEISFEAEPEIMNLYEEEVEESKEEHDMISMDMQISESFELRTAPQTEEIFNNVVEDEEQTKKIERHIQRIKELKNLNVTINFPGGIREMEREPAYKRRNKKLEDVPHSSETQISRLSLFEDASGKPELKSNNSFLHDNVD